MIRIAVVGVGRIGLTHAESLAKRVKGAQLVAVTTARPERAAAAREQCGEVAVYPDLEALLGAERLDAVVLASSTSAHAGNVVRCATAGLDILVREAARAEPWPIVIGPSQRSSGQASS